MPMLILLGFSVLCLAIMAIAVPVSLYFAARIWQWLEKLFGNID